MIEGRGLSYKYDSSAEEFALQNLNLTIEQGEYVLICGSSGSGKSTLCRLLNGLIPHFYGGVMEGRLLVAGLDTRHHPVCDLFKQVGLVFQNSDAQLFNSTVEREIAFGLESLGLERGEIQARIEWIAEVANVSSLLPRSPHQLSGGEKQLVAICAVLALRPSAIVLDEPYANLDSASAERIRKALNKINRLGTTVIVTEHRLYDLIEDVDRIIVLHQGQIALDGPPREVLKADTTEYGLNLPPIVRFFKENGLKEIPLSVEEGLALLKNQGLRVETEPYPPGPEGAQGGREVIRVRDVSFAFDSAPALSDVGLEIWEGECACLIGKNGSGKTTMIKHFNGLYKPKTGEVYVLGRGTAKALVSELARHVGIVFQNPNDQFFKDLVREEILVGPQALGTYDEDWCEEIYDLFSLRPLLNRSPYRLSEGEKKRVAFASILAARPEIIVLDEPTTGQDQRFKEALISLLQELRSLGHTIVTVTHDLEFAAQSTHRWIAMADGRVVGEGAPDEIMSREEVMKAASLKRTQLFELAHRLGLRQTGRLRVLS